MNDDTLWLLKMLGYSLGSKGWLETKKLTVWGELLRGTSIGDKKEHSERLKRNLIRMVLWRIDDVKFEKGY